MMLRFDPEGWHKTFLEERNNLQFYLRKFKVAIVHVGATAYKNGRSNRNVDILITVNSLADLSMISARLQTKKYKLINYEDEQDIIYLVGPKKINGYGVTIRVMLYASEFYKRYIAFITLLKEHEHLVKLYNQYRENIYVNYYSDWKTYRKLKTDYINLLLEEHFKFE